jgi:hypothetical protein
MCPLFFFGEKGLIAIVVPVGLEKLSIKQRRCSVGEVHQYSSVRKIDISDGCVHGQKSIRVEHLPSVRYVTLRGVISRRD